MIVKLWFVIFSGPSRMRSATTISGVGHVRHSSGGNWLGHRKSQLCFPPRFSLNLHPAIIAWFSGLPSSKPLTDSRNLSDKTVRIHCGREIYQFLVDNHYPNQIQAKELIQVTCRAKTFFRARSFLKKFGLGTSFYKPSWHHSQPLWYAVVFYDHK